MTSKPHLAPARRSSSLDFPDNSALIDRWVRIVAGYGEGQEVLISSLRERRCYVLLGEPGSGKTTVLTGEAKASGASMVTTRDFLHNPPTSIGASAYIDALDEYRMDGSSFERVDSLAAAMGAANVGRWRISCRSEDWRVDADIAAFKFLAGNEPLCVAELLPLNDAEGTLLLAHFGCAAPEQFLIEAERLGAFGFVANPLSLKLLYSATVSNNGWPQTRFELFGNAITELAHEHNRRRGRIDRNPSQEIIRAAGRMNLFLLVTGAQSIWLSNSAPPQEDRGRYLSVGDVELPAALVGDTLDTALFRGDGANFVPMHRTIAEFSAAQYLCEVIVGGDGAAWLPLSRVLAVVVGTDGAPPTELRALFGWFVTHLAHRGQAHLVRW